MFVSSPELQFSSQAHEQDWENAWNQARNFCLCHGPTSTPLPYNADVNSGNDAHGLWSCLESQSHRSGTVKEPSAAFGASTGTEPMS